MIEFERPWFLALVLPALALWLWLGRRGSRRGMPLPLDDWGGAPGPEAPWVWRLVLMASTTLGLAAWLATMLAASAPVRVERIPARYRSELDLMFVLDVSPSMAAMDLEPTRLDAARQFVRAFLRSGDGASGASVGVAAFGAEASLLCPPTVDYGTADQLLDLMMPGALGDGTAVGQGLALALRHLLAGSGSRKAAVLLTDGEDNAGRIHPLDAAATYRRYGVGLIVVGLGSQGDAPIEYVDPDSGETLKGSYRSAFSDAALAAIAEAGGGRYQAARDVRALEAAIEDVGALAGVDPGSASALPLARRTSLARPVMVLALILAAGSWLLRRLVLGGVA